MLIKEICEQGNFGDVKQSLDKTFGHNKDVKTKTTGQQTSSLLARLKKWIAGTLPSANTTENDQMLVRQLKQTNQGFQQGTIPPDQAMEKFLGILEKIGPVQQMNKLVKMMIPMLKGMQGMSAKPTEERDLQNTIDALERFLQKNQEHLPLARPDNVEVDGPGPLQNPNDKLPDTFARPNNPYDQPVRRDNRPVA